MKNKLSILLLLIILSSNNFAQNVKQNSIFLSVFGGDYSILTSEVEKFYGSRNGFVLGFGLGIPLHKNVTLDLVAHYYQKNSNYKPYGNNKLVYSAILKQAIANVGVQINLFSESILDVAILSGITLAMVDEERKNEKGSFVYETEGTGNFGFYVGSKFEVSLGKGPFAFYSDIKYNYTWNPVLEYSDNLEFLTISGGIKMYLSQRWK